MRRVAKSFGVLYGKRTARKRYICDGHLAYMDHHIEPGEPYVTSALPPESEIGNTGWWHHRFCMSCCPVEFAGEAA